jgi:hypothetical protein
VLDQIVDIRKLQDLLVGVVDHRVLERPGVAFGMNTALMPAARAGLMSDFGELPIIQVLSGSKPFVAISFW